MTAGIAFRRRMTGGAALLALLLLALQWSAATHSHAGEPPGQPEVCEICVLGHGYAPAAVAPRAPAPGAAGRQAPVAAAQLAASRPGVRAHASRAPPVPQA